MDVLIKGEIWTQTYTQQEQHRKTGVPLPQARELPEDRGLQQTLPSQPSGGYKRTDTLLSDHQPPELGDSTVPAAQAPTLRYFVTAALAN